MNSGHEHIQFRNMFIWGTYPAISSPVLVSDYREKQSERMPYFSGVVMCDISRSIHIKGNVIHAQVGRGQSSRMPHFRGACEICEDRASAYCSTMTFLCDGLDSNRLPPDR